MLNFQELRILREHKNDYVWRFKDDRALIQKRLKNLGFLFELSPHCFTISDEGIDLLEAVEFLLLPPRKGVVMMRTSEKKLGDLREGETFIHNNRLFVVEENRVEVADVRCLASVHNGVATFSSSKLSTIPCSDMVQRLEESKIA